MKKGNVMVNNTISATLNPPSNAATFLIVCVLITCLICLYMVFLFSRKLQYSAYIRESQVEDAFQQELKPLLTELENEAVSRHLDPNDPPPDEFGPTGHLWRPDKFVSVKEEPWEPEDIQVSEEEKTNRLARAEKKRLASARARAWEIRERNRYAKKRVALEKKAMKRAEAKIPKSFDISLLGGGWIFLLEFSTVIVILFALIILGILGTLEGREIAPILAAIAGYVLGKTTGAIQTPKGPVEPES